MKINKKVINGKMVSYFADIIGNIQIAINLESFKEVKNIYQDVEEKLLKWIKDYYENCNFDKITYEESLYIHEKLEDVKYKILPNKKIGSESILTDNILIRYEVIMKEINAERGVINERQR